jgi:tetrahydromethanopterin S-methyltransferase subunit G
MDDGKDINITNNQLFEFMTKMYNEMQGGFKQVNSRIDGVENEMQGGFKQVNLRIDGVENEMQGGFKQVNSRIDGVENEIGFKQVNSRIDVENEAKKTNTKIEHEIMPKLDVLFDGYKQNSDKLDRIQEEVSKHEEIILRRVK